MAYEKQFWESDSFCNECNSLERENKKLRDEIAKLKSSPVSVDINRDDELNHLRYELFHITAAHDELLEALKQLYEICPGNYMDYQPYGDALQRATEAISKASPPKQSGE